MKKLAIPLRMDNWTYHRLAEPFPADEIKWRVGSGRLLFPYIDARQVAERLNYVVGSENWSDRYIPVSLVTSETREITDYDALREECERKKIPLSEKFYLKNGQIVKVKNPADRKFETQNLHYGGIMCELTVLGVVKADVGTPSPTEELKGAYSDGFKRAAVKFGVGSYLYNLKNLRGGKVQDDRVIEPPTLPPEALPQPRRNPDEALMQIIEQVRGSSLPASLRLYLEGSISDHYYVMGRPNPLTPLIVKRALYETIKSVLDGRITEENLPSYLAEVSHDYAPTDEKVR